MKEDTKFIREAVNEAKKAFKKGEVPVGAVVVLNGKIIARGHNESITSNDPTAHAEIVALRKSAKILKNYRLNGAKMYVTIEPCPMCAGAMLWARISELVYGAKDKKAGACGGAVNIINGRKFNHKIKVSGGLLEKECREIMQKFFKHRR